MDSDEEYADSGGSSWMSDIDEIYEVYDDASPSPTDTKYSTSDYKIDVDNLVSIQLTEDSDDEHFNVKLSDEETENVRNGEVKRTPSPKKSFIVRCPSKWSPKIKSVCHVPRKDIAPVAKDENGHLVLVKEDEIKQEEELLNENDDDAVYKNDLRKSIFAEYPNLKIKDEFDFKGCCIKLEKIDFSYLESVDPLIKVNPVQDFAESTPSSHKKGRPRKRKPKKLRTANSFHSGRARSKTARLAKSRKNKNVEKRRSNRLKQKTLRSSCVLSTGIEEIRNDKSVLRRKTRISSNGNKRSKEISNTAALDDCDIDDFMNLRRDKKTVFMEANGLAEKRDESFASKYKANNKNNHLNSSAPLRNGKRVTFADDVNGIDSDGKTTSGKDVPKMQNTTPLRAEKEEEDPAEKYRLAITKYSSEIDSYKFQLNTYYECLCCDRKYHLFEQCKEHVRGHFPGCLTD